MIIAIVGHSASGKSTIEKILNEKYDIPRIVSYTTRPPRQGEIDGVHYHFIDEEKFKELESHGFFDETAKYREWYYGLSLKYIDYKNNNYVAVVTPHGYYEIEKVVHPCYLTSFFVLVSENERLQRLIDRGDEMNEISRRIENDRRDFKNFEYVADFIVRNDHVDRTADLVYYLVHEYLNK